jgi:hypothetical protein
MYTILLTIRAGSTGRPLFVIERRILSSTSVYGHIYLPKAIGAVRTGMWPPTHCQLPTTIFTASTSSKQHLVPSSSWQQPLFHPYQSLPVARKRELSMIMRRSFPRGFARRRFVIVRQLIHSIHRSASSKSLSCLLSLSLSQQHLPFLTTTQRTISSRYVVQLPFLQCVHLLPILLSFEPTSMGEVQSTPTTSRFKLPAANEEAELRHQHQY